MQRAKRKLPNIPPKQNPPLVLEIPDDEIPLKIVNEFGVPDPTPFLAIKNIEHS